ncbi:MAG: multicopper oxidase family protein [Dermatophilaceae bacterium]
MGLTRRDALKLGVAGGALAALPLHRLALAGTASRMPLRKMVAPFTLPFVVPPVLAPTGVAAVTCPDGVVREYDRYDMTQTFSVAQIMPGYQTPVFGYNGVAPGPTIVARRGRPIVVHQTNLLHQPPASAPTAPVPAKYSSDPMDRWTSTHLHGSASLPQYDGYASDVTLPGQTKRYVYPNSQEARTLWYHDHGVHHTSQNAYNGLAGMYLLHDELETTLGIPQGRYDVPVVVRDVMLSRTGALVYDDNGESGAFGDIVLVNGVPWPVMQVEPRKYRFRILNASVARSYEWQLHDGRSAVPMTVVGTDAGLVPEPQVVTSIRHAMGERYEVVVDFAPFAQRPGRAPVQLTLRNLVPKNTIDEPRTRYAMRFVVGPESSVQNTENNEVPASWTSRVPPQECMTWTEADLLARGVPERRFAFVRSNGQWTINGTTWQDVVDSDYTFCLAEPAAGAVEIWELANLSGGWFHPAHIHLVDFQVLSRNGQASRVHPYERGAKDVVYVGEEETVRVAMRFAGPSAGEGWPAPKGRYMMHCHNLVHEDHDMMMQFSVGDPDDDPEFDPIAADPAQ